MNMSILIDCGTNFKQGLTEILSKHNHIEKVYSFEANTITYDLLEKNDGFNYINAAVTDKNGFTKFYAEKATHILQGGVIFGDNKFIGGGSRRNIKQNNIDLSYYKEIIVPMISLSDFINFLNPPNKSIILKLDVEGDEYPVLENLFANNIFDLIEHLYVEFHEQFREKNMKNYTYYVDLLYKKNVSFAYYGQLH